MEKLFADNAVAFRLNFVGDLRYILNPFLVMKLTEFCFYFLCLTLNDAGGGGQSVPMGLQLTGILGSQKILTLSAITSTQIFLVVPYPYL